VPYVGVDSVFVLDRLSHHHHTIHAILDGLSLKKWSNSCFIQAWQVLSGALPDEMGLQIILQPQRTLIVISMSNEGIMGLDGA